ncbi:hypothetical protein DP113_24105 [Brasilonema octagenarum UFV-E1]|uniref:Uncharacterized protein n=2 Tax=Brasilonema TaxID=383614 RepID=A0A856MMZ7_9CYAN|nr:hypothetical protein [Brasilonema octagenarum UFV-OR1]QDL10587.1 hypothetical protein DP114_24210 [Brasilonema sennae CENA114]QDL16930.1 hypothetical protein DP113_24105 [Brasilonema octagenarum UFV-E1]
MDWGINESETKIVLEDALVIDDAPRGKQPISKSYHRKTAKCNGLQSIMKTIKQFKIFKSSKVQCE